MTTASAEDLAHTAAWFARAAEDFAGTSTLQSDWARGIAADPAAVARVAALPRASRAPSLLFSVARLLGAPAAPWDAGFRAWLLATGTELEDAAAGRRVQTNEVQRCVPLLVALARIPGPLALLELGASAGLCLHADRYAYRLSRGAEGRARAADAVLGDGAPLLSAQIVGELDVPSRMPEIVWRRGIDLAPLDVRDAADRAWLEALLPPDRPDRSARLAAAVATAVATALEATGSHPLDLRVGDAADAVPALLADVPADATPVVVSLGTLVYLPAEARDRIRAACAAAGARLVTFEPLATVPDAAARAAERPALERTGYLLALDGEPLAYGSAHGDRLIAIG